MNRSDAAPDVLEILTFGFARTPKCDNRKAACGKAGSNLTAFVAMLCGLVVVFTGGVSWLMIGGSRLELPAALAAGFYPFVVADFAKLLVASGVMPMLWKITGRANQR